jgi:poly-gamma-glutamate synthesis protein (capsule biosynthesis protein)
MKKLYSIIFILLLSACGRGNAPGAAGRPLPTIPPEWLTRPPTPEITVVAAGQRPETAQEKPAASPATAVATSEPAPEPTQTPAKTPLFHLPRLFGRQWTVSSESGVPAEFVAAARELAAERPDDFLWVEPGSLPTDITLTLNGGEPLASWLYVVAAPFATIEDEISETEVKDLWLAGEPAERRILVEKSVADLLGELWGNPGVNVGIEDGSDLFGALWEKRPSLTILPFHSLTPDLKALRLDGGSPFDPDFRPEAYPLRLTIGVEGEREALAAFLGAWAGEKTNFDPARLTRVAMTGVTALVRATATQMELDGILTPAVDVGPVLRAADIAHISNEVSFVADCREPNPAGGTSFCSQDEYFALLEEVGADVIELTGNHLNDYGAEHVPRSIDMYEAAGMDYFGGGRDAADAARAALFEHNGNRIALVGCNYFGPVYAWATETSAGSRSCDAGFYDQIRKLKEEGYLVIATQQYTEYYQYPPMPDQQADFQVIADAGADAVSGSQGHHAQGFEFYDGAFIHYGLGNLFFDQMDMLGTRQTFVDIYSVYDGRLVNVDLWTGLIENYSQPREMTTAERQQALQAVFEASGW